MVSIKDKDLYISLQNQYFRGYAFSWRYAGEGLEIIGEWMDGRFRDTYLVNHRDKTACQLLDESLRLTFLSKKAIDWKSMKKKGFLRHGFPSHADYGLVVEKFRDGVAMVEWRIYSENFRNSEYVNEGNKYSVYAYIDTHVNVVVPFKSVSYEEMQRLYLQAVGNAKRIARSEARVRRIKENHLYFGILCILKYAIGYPVYFFRSLIRRLRDMIYGDDYSDLTQEED